ncbi:MAG: hypothetical protein HY235_24060 [Acidobacteria bacterium]|nr:hypothetical protein [Acidobacteriota bacterium]
MSIVDPASKHPYRDSPSPLRFGAVSPFDPQLFARVDDFAEELLKGTAGGKYSPLVVSEWLEQLSQTAAKSLEEAQAQTAAKATPEFRRLAADVAIQSGIGRFFAHKLRAGVLWAIYDRTGEAKALEEALKAYRAAHRAWSGMANRARDVYARDITYGTTPHMRGHWIDRLPAIEEDIARMEKSRPSQAGQHDAERVRVAIQMALSPPKPIAVACRHTPPARFRPGAPLEIQLSLERGNGRQVRLHYRRVNQAERWQSIEMQWRDNRYAAVIPGPYTQSPYPLQYYFNLRHSADQIQIYPGLEATLSNQPYFVVRQA